MSVNFKHPPGITQANGDLRYLKLNTDNDPLTGSLDLNANTIVNIGASTTDFSSDGSLTIGGSFLSVLDGIVSFSIDDLATAATTEVLGLNHDVGVLTPEPGIGVTVTFQNDHAELQAILTDVTSGAEVADLIFLVGQGGVFPAELVRFDGSLKLIDVTGGIFIDQDSDSISLQIDSQATTADVVDFPSPTQTTGNIIDVPTADALTSGSIFNARSNSASTTARPLFDIVNDHASATGAVNLRLQQDSTGDILQVFDAGTQRFTIDDEGNLNMVTKIITNIGTGNTSFLTGGALDMAGSIISNIGNSGTDFNTAGGLTLAQNFTVTNGVASITIEDGIDSAVTNMLTLSHNTTGLPAAGIGTGILLQTDNLDGENQNVGRITAEWTDVGPSNTEDSKMILSAFRNGNSVNMFTVDAGLGEIVIGGGETAIDYDLKFDGQDNDGVITWFEDEDRFRFADDVNLPDNEKLLFGTAVDAEIFYDGSNLQIDGRAVGDGGVQFTGPVTLGVTPTANFSQGHLFVEVSETDPSVIMVMMKSRPLMTTNGTNSTSFISYLVDAQTKGTGNHTGTSICVDAHYTHVGTGTMSRIKGQRAFLENFNTVDANRTITDAYGFEVDIRARQGKITNVRSINIAASAPTGAGSITNHYGIYINNISNATNSFGIFIQGADDGAIAIDADGTSGRLRFGESQDWSFYFDATNMQIDRDVGAGKLNINARVDNTESTATSTARGLVTTLTASGGEGSTDIGNLITANFSGDIGDFNTHNGMGLDIDVNDTTVIGAVTEGVGLTYGIRTNVDFTGTFFADEAAALDLYGGHFTATGKAGASLTTQKIYGIQAKALGNLGTTGTMQHYGVHIQSFGSADINYGLYIATVASGSFNWGIFDVSGQSWAMDEDNVELIWGEGQDAGIGYDGTDLKFDSSKVGSGTLRFDSANNWTANGTATVTISNVAPAGVGTATISKWFTVKDDSGVVFYIPAWT